MSGTSLVVCRETRAVARPTWARGWFAGTITFQPPLGFTTGATVTIDGVKLARAQQGKV